MKKKNGETECRSEKETKTLLSNYAFCSLIRQNSHTRRNKFISFFLAYRNFCTFACLSHRWLERRHAHAWNQETPHTHHQAVCAPLRGNVLHQPFRADDAVCVAICGHAHRQGPHPRHPGTILLLHGLDDGATGTSPCHPALLTHLLRQPWREQ